MRRQPWSRRREPPACPRHTHPRAGSPAPGSGHPPAYIVLVTADPLPGPTPPSIRLRVLGGIGSPAFAFACTAWLQLKAQNVSSRN